LTAAVEVFAESGYQRGKMSEVARRVGVSEPVVFQNFGSKAALFAVVVEAAAERMSAAMREDAAGSPNVGAWLAGLLAPAYIAGIHEQGSFGVLLAEAMGVSAEPSVAEAARTATWTIGRALTEILALGQRDGSVRPDIDPDTGAWWLLSLFASQHFRYTTALEPGRLEAQMGELTLALLRQGPTRP
jgi:AcrR family transcriptional regulator